MKLVDESARLSADCVVVEHAYNTRPLGPAGGKSGVHDPRFRSLLCPCTLRLINGADKLPSETL